MSDLSQEKDYSKIRRDCSQFFHKDAGMLLHNMPRQLHFNNRRTEDIAGLDQNVNNKQ
jgi:hypothetical protein